MSDETPTRAHRIRQDARNLWLPVGSVIGMVAVVVPAASLWATDRAELNRNSEARKDHEQRLRFLEQALTERTVVERGILEELRQIRKKLETLP